MPSKKKNLYTYLTNIADKGVYIVLEHPSSYTKNKEGNINGTESCKSRYKTRERLLVLP